MPKLTLAQRLERAAARKARAEQEAARLKLIQKKERTRRLIELGGLAVKAGIDEIPPAALYACFLRIAAEAKIPNAITRWEHEGGHYFQAEEDARVVAIARFVDKIEPEMAATLRSLGFRWNRFLKQWEGKVDFAAAEAIVTSQGGTIEQLADAS
jgi:hypothetical protein